MRPTPHAWGLTPRLIKGSNASPYTFAISNVAANYNFFICWEHLVSFYLNKNVH